jgi:hypothetical protein
MASFAFQDRSEGMPFDAIAPYLDDAEPAPLEHGPAPDVAGGAADLDYAEHWCDDDLDGQAAQRAKDLAGAKKDLAQMFQIVDPEAVGPRLGNQVTQEEYDDICQRYSAIRMGDSALRFEVDGYDGHDADDPDYKNFKAGAMDDVAALMQTPTGRELIRSFQDNPDPNGGHTTFLDDMIAKPNAILSGVASDRFLFDKLGDAFYQERGQERPREGGDPRTVLSNYLGERRAIDAHNAPQDDS